MKFKNIIFDCESTLTKIEGLDFLACHKGLGEEVSRITADGMNGNLSFSQSFKRRLEIVQPTLEELNWLGEKYIENLVEDAQEIVEMLIRKEAEVLILSGGPRRAVERCGGHLGIRKSRITAINFPELDDLDIINYIGFQDLDGFKVETVKRVRKSGPTVLIGDGITDLEAGKHADLFIGFGGVVVREKVRREAAVYVTEPRLQGVLDYVL